METMSPDEIRAFLTTPARCGKLATVRADGRPHVVPVWFILDGDDLIFTASHSSIKARNIRRDGRVALCVDEDHPPYQFILLEGCVEVLDTSPAASLHWATLIGGRYMGADRAEEYGRRYGIEGEWVYRMTPDKVIAQKDVVA
jgi:PPOX class probable F420-dependent enzyme